MCPNKILCHKGPYTVDVGTPTRYVLSLSPAGPVLGTSKTLALGPLWRVGKIGMTTNLHLVIRGGHGVPTPHPTRPRTHGPPVLVSRGTADGWGATVL